MRIRNVLVILVVLIVFVVKPIWAQENNKVGIHILETAEVERAAALVNSSGGDWGYVTIVLRDDDLDFVKWQRFMDDCRELHLIPIIRLATHTENNWWAKPEEGNLDRWVDFLASLNWPVKQQIVVLFNEPNHAKEWGGEINPREYSTLVNNLIQKFKESNSDFYLMLAGLDQAADGQKGTMKEEEFLSQMAEAVPDIFEKVDGWCSHSYPRNFVGLPTGQGRNSIKGYEWELQKVEEVDKSSRKVEDWEVYITETGWQNFDEEKIAEYMVDALKIWEKDERVKAVTPFVLNYPAEPFERFSWIKKDGSAKQSYEKVLGVNKVMGEPEQRESFEVVGLKLAEILPTDYEYQAKVKIKNTGQWIMGEENNIKNKILNIKNESEGLKENSQCCQISQYPVLTEYIYPEEEEEMDFKIKTGTESGECRLKIDDQEYPIYTFKPFELKNEKVSLWRQIKTKVKLWLRKE
jgi:hypothetical protein